MAFDPIVYDDFHFKDGRRVPATTQIHFVGRDGQLREITLSDDNADVFWDVVKPFEDVARLTGLKVPPIPDKLKAKGFLAPSARTGPAKSVSEVAAGSNEEALRDLGDGRILPERFWQTPKGASTSVQTRMAEMRKKIRIFQGVEPGSPGQVPLEIAYRWGRENPEEVLEVVGLW